jgi:transcriptional regulator with XRE-family HTH domain
MLAKRIGENIKAARKAKNGGKGWSLEKVAARIQPKTSYQQLSRLESGERPLSLEWIEKIAKALEVDPMELLAPDQTTGSQGFQLDEQVATDLAREIAEIALRGEEPDTGIVQDVALLLRDLTATFSIYPEAASDVRVARPVIAQAARRFVREAN